MSLTDPPGTLAYHGSRVLTTHRDMSLVPMSSVSGRIKHFMSSVPNKGMCPETEALTFYGMNHGVALISAERHQLQPLGAEDLDFVDRYHARLGPAAVRAFVYLMLICTRESRHCSSTSKVVTHASKHISPHAANFFGVGSGEQGIHNKLMSDPPTCTVGQWVKTMQWAYYNASWPGGYGGKKWGQVTDCLVRFVYGEFTAEMMLDTVWTLAHNGGPIFNKGHCYGMYSGYLARLLDVQRSGQIPELVMGEGQYAETGLEKDMSWLKKRFPSAIGDYVDWFKVEALGSVHKYEDEKKTQLKTHGDSPEHKKLKADMELAEKAKKLKEAQDLKVAEDKAALTAEEFNKKHYQVDKTTYLEKVELEREEELA